MNNTEYWKRMKAVMKKQTGCDHNVLTDWYECPTCLRKAYKDEWNCTETHTSNENVYTHRTCPQCEVEVLIIAVPDGVLLVDYGEIL